MQTITKIQAADRVALKKQPKALKTIFMVEMWERFSYFAVQSILIIYLSSVLHMTDKSAFLVFGAFGTMVYLTPLIGGYLADNLLGRVHAVSLGAILLVLGYFLLAINSSQTLYVALAVLTLGNGLFKPNMSTLLGSFYEKNDIRRENGFTLYYVAINIGATIGVVLCGFLVKQIGWSVVYLIVGSGMALGTLIFVTSITRIKRAVVIQSALSAKRKWKTLYLYGALIVACVMIRVVLLHPEINKALMALASACLVILMLAILIRCNYQDRRNVLYCVILSGFSVAFWALYQQAPMSLTLFAARDVNLKLLGVAVPATTLWALNGIFLIGLAPVVIKLWSWLSSKGIQIKVATKFALGILLMGMGYLLLDVAAETVVKAHRPAALGWVVASYGIQALGELLLSPVGLAMITEVAPKNLRGLLMGVWLFAMALATTIGSYLAGVANVPQTLQHSLKSAPIYQHAFGIYGLSAISVGILLWLIAHKLNQLLSKEEVAR